MLAMTSSLRESKMPSAAASACHSSFAPGAAGAASGLAGTNVIGAEEPAAPTFGDAVELPLPAPPAGVAVVRVLDVAAGVAAGGALGVFAPTKRHSAPEMGEVPSNVSATTRDIVAAPVAAAPVAGETDATRLGVVLSIVKGALICESACGSSGLDNVSLASTFNR